MSKTLTVLQPHYVSDFHCIGSECEDTCCHGGTVVIDKPTYDMYQHVSDPELRPIMDRVVVPNPTSTHDATFAIIADSHLGCAFLTEDRLCSIQQRLGESYLSRACTTYPRAITRVDGLFERALYLACPEAARLVLLNPNAMDFADRQVEWDDRFDSFPSLDTSDPAYLAKPYRHFRQVRGFVDVLLRDRNYALWERLMILGIFCDQLNGMTQLTIEAGVPEAIASFTNHIEAGLFRDPMNNVVLQPAVQFRLLTTAIEHRLASETTGSRFVECYQDFLRGVQYSAESTLGETVAHYSDAYARYYAPFMARHPHILENYLLNYTFRNLFPYGPQRGVYPDERGISDHYLLLALQYSMVRSLLIGMAGYHKEDFGVDHVVKLVQSFSKAIEHDPPYLERILTLLRDNDMTTLAMVGVLLKN